MKCSSVSSSDVNPYKAGLYIGTELSRISPEVVLTFPCINFEPFHDYLEGLYDGLGDQSVIVVGGTGDGYFEKGLAKDVGATALGINSEGKIKYHHLSRDIEISNSEDATFEAASELIGCLGDDPSANRLLFCFSDYRADGTAVGKGLARATNLPVVGGFFGQHLTGFYCYGFLNREVSQHKMILLAMEGDFSFELGFASGWEEISESGIVTKTDKNVLLEIDGLPATEFFENQTGIPAGSIFERGIVAVRATPPPDSDLDYKYIRAIDSLDPESGGVSLLGGVETGDHVRVCRGNQDTILDAVLELAEGMKTRIHQPPQASIVVSCAGRKKLLGHRFREEIDAISEVFGSTLPLVGFPSFGEIAPVEKSDGLYHNLYHNMTIMLLTVNDRTS